MEWEQETYVNVTSRLAWDPDLFDAGTHAMLDIVAHVLATGPEDAAFVLNSDYLLLTRVNGVTTKHRRSVWWDHHGWPDEVIPGNSPQRSRVQRGTRPVDGRSRGLTCDHVGRAMVGGAWDEPAGTFT